MLQQTGVAAVSDYFRRFLARWPRVEDLAGAAQEEVMGEWAGLGYYARARNLHAAAAALSQNGFPDTEAGWRALPGVGVYTAAAVAAIALNLPANVVDANVERVMARLHAFAPALPAGKAGLHALAARYVRADRPGDWAQALMDLGATVCTPKSPACGACPVAFACAARRLGDPAAYPRKGAKRLKSARRGVAFWLEQEGHVLLVRRPQTGLLGGMAGLPSTPWRAQAWTRAEALAYAPAPGRWRAAGAVEHVFTHFTLTLEVMRLRLSRPMAAPDGGRWVRLETLAEAGLPTLFRKACARAAAL